MDKGREVGAPGTTHIVEDPKKSYNVKVKYDDDIFDNILIKGDNLLVLMALEQDFADKVNCIYIDPSYNTGNAFEHYNDGLEHSIWLGLMRGLSFYTDCFQMVVVFG